MSEILSSVPLALWLILLLAAVISFYVMSERKSIQARSLQGAARKAGTGLSPISIAKSRADLVMQIHQLALTRADDAERWYDSGRNRKKRLGVGLRLMAIALTAAAGLHPLIQQAYTLPAFYASPVMPSIFIALAALLVLFDRFGGHTTGWIRFMKAQMSIDQTLAAYNVGWLAERGIEAEPTRERADRLLQRSLKLIRSVDRTARDETDEWAAEFRKVLAETERAVEEARRRMDSGSLEVNVTNFDVVPDGRWMLQVGDSPERSVTGARGAETGVPNGIHHVRGSTTVNGLVCQDERAVEVKAGAVTPVELTFTPPRPATGSPSGGNGAGSSAGDVANHVDGGEGTEDQVSAEQTVISADVRQKVLENVGDRVRDADDRDGVTGDQ